MKKRKPKRVKRRPMPQSKTLGVAPENK